MSLLSIWQTPAPVKRLQLILITVLTIILYFIRTTLPNQSAADIFIGIFIMGVLLSLITKSDPLGWGANTRHAIDAAIAGIVAILAINLLSFGLKLAIPLSIPLSTNSVFSVFYVVITAAFVEEFVFRERLMGVFISLFKNAGIAGAFSSIIFGIFHLAAYAPYAISQGIPVESLLLQAAIFGGIAIIGNFFMKSTAFGLGLHLANNILVFTRAIAH